MDPTGEKYMESGTPPQEPPLMCISQSWLRDATSVARSLKFPGPQDCRQLAQGIMWSSHPGRSMLSSSVVNDVLNDDIFSYL